jgi:MFS family permease
MRSILASLVTLMGSSFFVHMANAAITTMIALVVAQSGGEQSDVALIAASYSLGFIAGCFLTPRHIVRIGLIRGFAAAAAILTISIVALDLAYEVSLWAMLRFSMGASMAAILAISDAWINNKAPSDQRGRIIAVYAILLGSASLVGQIVFLVADAGADGFVLTFAITTNIAVVVVAIASRDAPVLHEQPKRRLFSLTSTSMAANVGAFASGFMVTSTVSILPFYQLSHGVDEDLVAVVLITLHIGRLAFMWPVGRLSDGLGRGKVLTMLSSIVISVMVLALVLGEGEGQAVSGEMGVFVQTMAFFLILLLGGAIYPIYSVSSALAFDKAGERSIMDVSTTLLAINSVGAIVGPFTVSIAGELFGDFSLLLCLLVVAGMSFMAGLSSRKTLEPTEVVTASVTAVPPTSVEMAQAAAEVVEEEHQKAAEESAQDAESEQVNRSHAESA